MNKTKLVAEVGSNYDGSLDKALKYNCFLFVEDVDLLRRFVKMN